MTEMDHALASIVADPADGQPRQLRGRRNFLPRNDPCIVDGTGQLVAGRRRRTPRPTTATKSPSASPAVLFDELETAPMNAGQD